MTSEAVMSQWVVYDHPRDFPNCFVARRWDIEAGKTEPVATANMIIGPDLEGVRSQLPPGLVCLQPSLGDDASIVEVWL